MVIITVGISLLGLICGCNQTTKVAVFVHNPENWQAVPVGSTIIIDGKEYITKKDGVWKTNEVESDILKAHNVDASVTQYTDQGKTTFSYRHLEND